MFDEEDIIKIEQVLDYCKGIASYIAEYNDSDAQDIVGEVGLWIAENPKKFREIEHPKAFFFKVMKRSLKNLKLQGYKKESKFDDSITHPISHPDCEWRADYDLLLMLLSNPKEYGKYIKSNNKGQSHLIYKDWIEGLTTKEIMEKHGINKSSVSMNVKRAKEIVNQFFREQIYHTSRIYRYGMG